LCVRCAFQSDDDLNIGEEYNHEVDSNITDGVNGEKRGYEEYRPVGRERGLSSAEQTRIVDMHNKLRRGEGSSDMQILVSSSFVGCINVSIITNSVSGNGKEIKSLSLMA